MVQAASQREGSCRVLCLEAFISLLQAGILGGGVLGEGSVDCASVLQVCSSRVMAFTDWSVPGQGVSSHCSWFWVAHLVLLLF